MAKKKNVIRLYNYGNGRYEQLNLNLSNSNDANAGNALRANIESTWDLPFVHSTLSGLPTFPDELFKTDALPPLFESITQGFVDPRHRDVAFLSTLVFASALFPNVKAQYGSDYHHANLFGMIVAPSSVGKSNIRVGEYLVMPLVEKYREEYLIQYQLYRLNEDTMPKPKEKRLIISANSSDSALIDALSNSDGRSIVYSNEMDAQASKEWSNLSPLFRLMFDHQMVAKERVSESVYVSNPKCSVLYSGTPNQLSSVISDFDTGLHQRFLMYTFGGEVKWIDPFKSTINLPKTASGAFSKHLQPLLASYGEKEILFALSQDQQQEFNSRMNTMLEEFKDLLGGEKISLVTRGGNLFHRIAMVLSIARNVKAPQSILCDDRDFRSAEAIFNVCLRHSNYLADSKAISCPRGLLQTLKLFRESTEVIELQLLRSRAAEEEIPDSTFRDQLSKLVKLGFVEKVKHGQYQIAKVGKVGILAPSINRPVK